jgi:hypothetical protein
MRLADRVARSLRKATGRFSRRSPASLMPSGEPIFLHRPHGQPCHGITQEVIRDFELLAHFVLRNSAGNRYRVPKDVTFITYHNYTFKCLIERCYETYGIRNYVVLGRDVVRWDWGAKVRLVLDYLESGACTTRYVLCTDADDVLMVRDPSTMLDRFRTYTCDLLFCNTFVDYPPNEDCRDFETLKYYTHPLHCRLSAGAYMAEKEGLASCLRELVEAYREKAAWALYDGAFVDQLGWRYLHSKYYPKIQVDYRCLIFKRYDLFRDVVE